MKILAQGYIFTIFTAALIMFLTHFSDLTREPQGKKKGKVAPAEMISTNINGQGIEIEISFTAGEEHNHPLMVFWTEDTLGNYLQTLYVARSIATGTFNYGDKSDGMWKPGAIKRPAALPYWGHKRGIQTGDGLYIPEPQNPIPDAYTGATPKGDFILNAKMDSVLNKPFIILMEINQSWDWNSYWTNNKYPDDAEYKTSSQPALVYQVTIDPADPPDEYVMKPVGHSHYSGKDGILYTDLTTITTALDIVDKVVVRIK